MKFSCVTLSYNQTHFLQEAIDSIKLQERDFEYLIYDPGSQDGSRFVAMRNQDKCTKVMLVDGDKGPADGLNKSLAELHGDIFYYLNADDVVLPGAFKFVEQYFLDYPDCDVLHGSINIIDFSGAFIKVLPSMKFSLRGYALGYAVVYQQATFIRTRVLKDVRFNIDNRISWDGELIVDLAINGARIHSTKKVLGEFRIYSESITGSSNYKSLARKQHKVIRAKILGRNRTPLEIILASFIRISKAVSRRMFPRIEYLT